MGINPPSHDLLDLASAKLLATRGYWRSVRKSLQPMVLLLLTPSLSTGICEGARPRYSLTSPTSSKHAPGPADVEATLSPGPSPKDARIDPVSFTFFRAKC